MLVHPFEVAHCCFMPSGLLLPSLFKQCSCASSDHKPQSLPLSCEQDCTTLTYYQLLLVQNITPHTSYLHFIQNVCDFYAMLIKTHTKTITYLPLLCTGFFRLQNALVHKKKNVNMPGNQLFISQLGYLEKYYFNN